MAVDCLVTISIVTFNSRDEIERCLHSVFAQTCKSFSVVVRDNASTDGTAEFLKSLSNPRLALCFSKENLGFSAAHNRTMAQAKTEFVLVLNPDCYLNPDYLERVIEAARRDARIGAVAGKLYRLRTPDQEFASARQEGLLDSTGNFFTPSFRHFDRGSNEVDCGQYAKMEYVFGVTGAAAFYRREMLETIQVEGEYFDEGFFVYREDADLAWRMQSAGWSCVYTPHAVGYHVRKVFPANRSQVARVVNMHSVKNRFLFRLNNVSWQTGLRFFIPMVWRDLQVIGYTLLSERSSLPGLFYVLRYWGRRWRRRRLIQQKRRVSLPELHRWIHWRPKAFEIQS